MGNKKELKNVRKIDNLSPKQLSKKYYGNRDLSDIIQNIPELAFRARVTRFSNSLDGANFKTNPTRNLKDRSRLG